MRVGLVLSGGGARGIAHVGVMKALTEMGIQFSVISGTSAGAVAGAYFAAGCSFNEMMERLHEMRILRNLRPAWGRSGLLRLDIIESFVKEGIPSDTFESLKIPLIVAATNLHTGNTEYFSSGQLSRPVIASCCVPALFAPVEINNQLYVDGGVLDNLPAAAIVGKCDFIIGSHCNPVDHHFDANSLRKVAERALLLTIGTNTRESMAQCNVIIEPPGLSAYSAMDFGKAENLVEIGYRYVMENFSPESFKKL
mgnify:CR=1 FL=1